MQLPSTNLPPEPSGNSAETNWFRQLLRCIRERTVAVGPGLRASYFSDRTLIELAKVEEVAQAGPVADELKRYTVVEVRADYLVCVEEGDSPVDGAQVSVMKPLNLTATFQGVDFSWADDDVYRVSFINTTMYKWNRRRLTSNSTGRYWDEFLDPYYGPSFRQGASFDSSTITARKLKIPGAIGHDGQPIYWEDINVEARHYRPMPLLTALCVNDSQGNPVTKYTYVAGGPLQD